MSIAQVFALIVLVLLLGMALGRIASRLFYRYEERQATRKANLIIREAKIAAAKLKRDKMGEVKDRFTRLKAEFEQSVVKRKEKLLSEESYVRSRRQAVLKQLELLHRKEYALEKAKEELEKLRYSKIKQLESITTLSASEAQDLLMDTLEKETKSRAAVHTRTILENAKAKAEQEAKKVILNTIQRTASEKTIEACSSTIELSTDALKGQIIGKEGRNIRAFEAVTGVDVIVDETPKAISLSSFDPVRREIARLALLQLIQDGRIHPARIEEVVSNVSTSIEKEIEDTGERTVIDLGIYGMQTELTKLVGKMRYRASYGQNLLKHSCEVANLAANMASDLGLNSKLAKRAGLLHDIGKITTGTPGISHALSGMALAKKYREHPEVCNAIGSHHDETEMTSMLSPVVQACDAISSSRPGARREVIETYVKRLQDMENIALAFEGVKNCYAIQAGRELRVVVDSEQITDERAHAMSFDISSEIEQRLQYPSQVKVIVIRETRAINYAR